MRASNLEFSTIEGSGVILSRFRKVLILTLIPVLTT